MTGEQYRRYPKSQAMRRVSIDARDLGDAGAETSAGTSGAPDATTSRRQNAAESVEILSS